MIHTILYYGRFSLNIERLHHDKETFKIMRPDNGGYEEVAEPSPKVNGIVFGLMEKSGLGLSEENRFYAVKVESIILNEPIRLISNLHTDGKGFGPVASQFEDESAKRLLNDIIVANPGQRSELSSIYYDYFRDIPQFTSPEEVTNTKGIFEGALRQVKVNFYERSTVARQTCIEHYGTDCVVCGFNFLEKYGEIGDSYIHVHHLRPLSEIGETYEVDPITDLKPMCPNCHAMIHKREPPFSIEELKEHLAVANQNAG